MGNSASVDPCAEPRAPVHMFTSSKSWIEGDAIYQLHQTAALKGVTAVAAMPDLHPGKYGPVGCAVLSSLIHPGLVGADIGCGMGLFRLDTELRKLRIEKAAERLREGLAGPWTGDPAAALAHAGVAQTAFDGALGTIGGGNHFCELQAIDEIVDGEAAARAGLDPDQPYVLVHSGSRGFGFSILERVLAGGLPVLAPDSVDGAAYLAAHDHAAAWAKVNRTVVAARAGAALRATITPVNDIAHNMVEQTARGLLHRKGAAAADRGLVPVPGSRGAHSYLVEPLAAGVAESLASLAHGAGRKYERSAMRGRAGTKRSDRERLVRNPFGGFVICEDANLLVEEAPEAYKSIEQVIADLTHFGLARVVAVLKPLVTFKAAKDSTSERQPTRHRRGKPGRDRRAKDWEDLR